MVKLYITEPMFEAWWKTMTEEQQLEVTQNIAELFAKRHLKGVALQEVDRVSKEIRKELSTFKEEVGKDLVKEYANMTEYGSKIASLKDAFRMKITEEVSHQVSLLIHTVVEEKVKERLATISIEKTLVSQIQRLAQLEAKNALLEKIQAP